MDQRPLVSVNLLTYNHAEHISRCIDNILNQKTNFSFEVIIGDDCSTDGNTEICKEYAAKYPDKITFLTDTKNIGPQPNNIRTIEKCQGKYMAFIEGDDYWIDEFKLQKQVDFLEANPDFSLCFTNMRVDCIETQEPSYLLNEGIEKDVFTLDDLIGEKEIWFMGSASLMMRLDTIRPIRPWFYNTKTGDIVMIIWAARYGKIKYLPDVTAVYQKHSLGTSSSDHKDDAGFLKNRIMMYENIDRDTDYKFHNRLKRNIGGWYYLLINSKQYRTNYFKKLPVALKYIFLMFPNIPNLKLVLRDHLAPSWIMEITRFIRRSIGLIN